LPNGLVDEKYVCMLHAFTNKNVERNKSWTAKKRKILVNATVLMNHAAERAHVAIA